MKIITLLFCALMATSLVARAENDAPPENMLTRAAWARETKDLNLRIKRLEEFLKHYISLEEGVKITTEYEDGSSIYAVTGSAWALARAYVEAGQKDKALKVIDWLQENDSKSDLFPKKAKSEQGATSKTPVRCESSDSSAEPLIQCPTIREIPRRSGFFVFPDGHVPRKNEANNARLRTFHKLSNFMDIFNPCARSQHF